MVTEIRIEIGTLKYILDNSINDFYDSNGFTLSSRNRKLFVDGVIEKLEHQQFEYSKKAAADTVNKICEIFHLQETQDWEEKAQNLIIDFKLG